MNKQANYLLDWKLSGYSPCMEKTETFGIFDGNILTFSEYRSLKNCI
jgi:hypothetical protein